MKTVFVVILTIFAVSIYTTSAQSHNKTFGFIGHLDFLVARELVVKRYKDLTVQILNYEYPRNGFDNLYTITGIRCIDLFTNDKGGFCSLSRGGPGNKEVTISVTSQRGHGFGFYIEVYASEVIPPSPANNLEDIYDKLV